MAQPGVVERAAPSDGRANQLRVADTLNMLNENDFPGTQAENFVLRWMYRSPQTPVWGCAKRTENKRNKADHGPIEY